MGCNDRPGESFMDALKLEAVLVWSRISKAGSCNQLLRWCSESAGRKRAPPICSSHHHRQGIPEVSSHTIILLSSPAAGWSFGITMPTRPFMHRATARASRVTTTP